MISLHGVLAFLLPLPARIETQARRRRSLDQLRLSPHLRRDAGLDDYDEQVEDWRWSRRMDLER